MEMSTTEQSGFICYSCNWLALVVHYSIQSAMHDASF